MRDEDVGRGSVGSPGGDKPPAQFLYYITCDCVPVADTLMMVSMYDLFFKYLALRRRHETKCKAFCCLLGFF